MSDDRRWPHVRDIHLTVSDLASVVVDTSDVRSVRAEDASGAFGLLPGHTDLLTVLRLGVLSWRGAGERWRHCALRGGVLTMRRGCELQVATREAVVGDDLHRLEDDVLSQMAIRQRAEDQARREARQLQLRALRELMRPLREAVGGGVVDLRRLP
ncbi:MAG TPA: F0F1 ATP synthase subunit epsilon [Burkholderiaceae bacterium]|nr:F0F1 ATP synthase subunit epsilon [Burkholderiaceae bacterium]